MTAKHGAAPPKSYPLTTSLKLQATQMAEHKVSRDPTTPTSKTFTQARLRISLSTSRIEYTEDQATETLGLSDPPRMFPWGASFVVQRILETLERYEVRITTTGDMYDEPFPHR